jgi:DNA-binding NarL/FixJ family response regulator
VIDPEIVDGMLAQRSRALTSPVSELTAREREVLANIAAGKSNAAIASDLYVTRRAVEKHVHSIFVKLALSSVT